MAILWMGCQPEDLNISGPYSVSTGGAYHDINYSTGAVNPAGYPYQYGNGPNTRFISQNFSQPSSDFWFSFRTTTDLFSDNIGGYGGLAAPGRPWLWFTDSTLTDTLKMRLSVNFAFSDRSFYVRLYDNAGGATTLASRSIDMVPPVTVSGSQNSRFDVHVRFAKTDGVFQLFQSGVLLIDFAGDTLGSLSAAQVDGWALGPCGYHTPCFSEVFAIEKDCRTFRLKAHTMTALDPANQWSGVVGNINEFVPDVTTIMSSTAADQVLDAAVSDLPNTSMYPYAVKISVRAAKADDGLNAIQFGVKTNGTDVLGADIPLDTAFTTFSHTHLTNPTTGNNWTASEINDLHLIVKSRP